MSNVMRILLFLSVLIYTFNFSFGQELKLKYELSMSSDDPEMQTQLQMSEGSSLTIYAQDEKSRVEMNMGALMKTTTILDMEKGQGLMLMEGMFGKQAAKFEGEDFTEYSEQDEEIELELLDETKEILGYQCKKAIYYSEEDDVEMTFWYTEEIELSEAYLMDNSKYGIPGIALEYFFEQPEATMTYKAVEIETELQEENLFELNIPEGYSEKSFRDITNMSGQ